MAWLLLPMSTALVGFSSPLWLPLAFSQLQRSVRAAGGELRVDKLSGGVLWGQRLELSGVEARWGGLQLQAEVGLEAV
jgi:hypothetical protein